MLGRFQVLGKHHYFIYSIVLLSGLIVAIYVVNDTLSATGDDTYRQTKEQEMLKGNFDQATIKKIEELNKSTENSTAPAPPSGVRSNPFAE